MPMYGEPGFPRWRKNATDAVVVLVIVLFLFIGFIYLLEAVSG